MVPTPAPSPKHSNSPGLSCNIVRSSSSSQFSEASDELPNNVGSVDQLDILPEECLSGDKDRPLRHVDELGEVSYYSLQPMLYSVVIILFVELVERFSFYGINYTQTSYLTGAYNRNWNADMEAVSASSYVSISVAVAYTTPFIGAFLADSLLGDYLTIFTGALGFYLPGLFLIALTTIPRMLGDKFNLHALKLGLLLLWPAGTGIVKSVVNVFGAKQFHPILQTSMIESYYVNFYMCINIGALVGGIVIPLIAQHNVTVAYFLPTCVLTLGVMIFAMGSTRYVKSKPKGSLFGKKHKSLQPTGDTIPLFVIFRISLLIIPFNIAYSQMATTFIVQGTVMEKGFGWIDAACMNNADALSVLFFGRVIGTHFYPALAKRGIKIPTTYKFAIGSTLGALAIAWALLVEYRIHKEYEATKEKISILWQAVSYVLIGSGEIFAVSAAYEVAFTASPPEKKALASAINLFCVGSLPNVICIMLYHACRKCFINSHGTASITHLKDYATANVGGYFFILLLIAISGIIINLLPQVREFVESIEERATDLVRTPKTPMRPSRMKRAESFDSATESPLIHAKRHQAYLKYGSGPVLYKSGSMRAGPSITIDKQSKKRAIRKKEISMLYKGEMGIHTPSSMYRGEGKLLIPGAVLKPTKYSVPDTELPQVQSESDPLLKRADSV
mmetsp:Transcript_3945/g.7583  ORF Transcript_3945/g.7583 Transcript_3945/m.7583 type:complete len:675 (+) Transcript_3945:270-2294(+)